MARAAAVGDGSTDNVWCATDDNRTAGECPADDRATSRSIEFPRPGIPHRPGGWSRVLRPAGWLVHTTGVPGPPLASGLPEPSLAETGAEAGDFGRWRLDPPTTATTAAQPVAIETIVTPSFAGTTPFWLQPADPLPVPDTVSFNSGPHHAGETVRPPLVTTTFPELDPVEVGQILGTGEGVSHPAPLPPPWISILRAGISPGPRR